MWGGQLSDKYGGSAVLAGGLFAWSAAAMLTPWAAGHSAGALLAARAWLGMGQGVAFPAIHVRAPPLFLPVAVALGAFTLWGRSQLCGQALRAGELRKALWAFLLNQPLQPTLEQN